MTLMTGKCSVCKRNVIYTGGKAARLWDHVVLTCGACSGSGKLEVDVVSHKPEWIK